MILLDTNIISELRKSRPHGAVASWYQAHPASSYGIAAVSLYELQAGTELTRRQDPAKASELDRWIRQVEQSITILPLGAAEARTTAFLMRRQAQELLIDAMISATALVSGLTVATRNIRDFERFGVPLVNPFEYKG